MPAHTIASASIRLRFIGVFVLCCVLLTSSGLRAEDRRFYDPVERDIAGWTISVDPQLLTDEHQATWDKARTALENHLQRVGFIVAEPQLSKLKNLPIWLELENARLKAMQYHPDRGWLIRNEHDPRLEKHVHIPRASDLFARHTWAKHPYVILHELAHAYHDQILSFDEPRIVSCFQAARDAKTYENVLLYTGRKVKHYGLTNHKEYFAEASEAYLGVNDFYPFVRAELQEHDPEMFRLLEQIWGKVE